MNVLAIGAHFDDVELGCGGTLARYAKSGDAVYVYVATVSGFSNQYNEAVRSSEVALAEGQRAMKVLGVTEMMCGGFKTLEVEFIDALNVEILRIVKEKRIDTVLSHWPGDIHHDHQAVGRASIHACRHVPRQLLYRSNWYQSTQEFRGNFYVDITDTWETKERAILSHESEVERTGRKWLQFFRNEAQNAGQRIGVPLAEVFEALKYLAA
jgi:LmbE family N-acetylglucosaminyl deacetylase